MPSPGAQPASPTRATARSSPGTMRVRSTVGHRVNWVPTTASPTQPSTFRCTWARRSPRPISAGRAAAAAT